MVLRRRGELEIHVEIQRRLDCIDAAERNVRGTPLALVTPLGVLPRPNVTRKKCDGAQSQGPARRRWLVVLVQKTSSLLLDGFRSGEAGAAGCRRVGWRRGLARRSGAIAIPGRARCASASAGPAAWSCRAPPTWLLARSPPASLCRKTGWRRSAQPGKPPCRRRWRGHARRTRPARRGHRARPGRRGRLASLREHRLGGRFRIRRALRSGSRAASGNARSGGTATTPRSRTWPRPGGWSAATPRRRPRSAGTTSSQ